MVEIIKELAGVLKDLPDLAIWIMVGILFYKVAIIGSIFGVIRLGIIKLHDAFTKPKETIKYHDISSQFIVSDKGFREFTLLLDQIRRERGGHYKTKEGERGSNLKYIHMRDVEFLKEAYMEKVERDDLRIQTKTTNATSNAV